jgi:RNA polymerase sigma factor (sigma-70 family)
MSESSGSVSFWIRQLQDGCEGAADAIWQRFHKRLLQIAARTLPDYVRREEDEEDVVNIAFHSFFRRLHNGSFPDLQNRNELWKLLSSITRRKATNLIRNKNRKKRANERVCHNPGPMDQYAGDSPTPDFVVMHRETIEHLLSMLDEGLREIALYRLDGCTNQEIAAAIRRSVPTVERRLRLIRQKWEGLDE